MKLMKVIQDISQQMVLVLEVLKRQILPPECAVYSNNDMFLYRKKKG
jgi:hypothetical protein